MLRAIFAHGVLKLVAMSEAEQAAAEEGEEIEAEHKERISQFAFSKCGIEIGETIEYADNPKIVCKVIEDKAVEYEGQKYSLSALASVDKGKHARKGRKEFCGRRHRVWRGGR